MEITTVFSANEITLQVARILDSPSFKCSSVLSRFLEFIVHETIYKNELQIKEYSIAINVLGRSTDFNPHDDAVVRIHAGRLRRALNDYYLTQGIYDPIIIYIPKGSYIPKFAEGGSTAGKGGIPTSLPEPFARPIVAILPLRIINSTPKVHEFSLILGEQICAELSRFQDIAVIGYYSLEMTNKIRENIIDACKSVNADYVITGNLQYLDNQIHIIINLVLTETGEILLSKSFDKDFLQETFFSIQDEIVKDIVSEVGSHDGIVARNLCKQYQKKS